MSLRCLVLAVLLSHFSKDVHAAEGCTELPVFVPPRLVVKFGDPAFASCSICNGSCDYVLRLEEPLKSEFKRGKDVIWNVTSLKQWDAFPFCYVFATKGCERELEVVVYQPPESVSMSLSEGPLMEGQSYYLLCDVKNVAPAQNMTVVFYRGHTQLDVQRSYITDKGPVDESFILNYTVSREDHGDAFWCETILQLGPEGPQPPPVVTSHNITVNVFYKPYRPEPVNLIESISVTHGSSVRLNCSSEGNPRPHYTWTIPSASHTLYSDSVFTIDSASNQHQGVYTCKASNKLGAFQRTFNVTVHFNYVLIIIAVVVGVLVLAAVGAIIFYTQYYKYNRTGHYNFKDALRLRRHVAVPTIE